MIKRLLVLLCAIFALYSYPVHASLTEEELARLVVPPLELGTKDDALPIWRLLNGGGALIGYIFESRDLAPIPGFSGTPMNLLIAIDQEGKFMEVSILDQNEPVFVSGLGIRPFHTFLQQYVGKSLASNIKISSVQGNSQKGISSYIEIDGVTKATASVRIANKTILAAALKVAREHLAGIAPKPVSYPKKDLFEKKNWDQLLKAGLIKHITLKNKDVEVLFAGTDFAEEDEIALDEPDDLYLDLWVADIGLPTVMKNLMSEENQTDLNNQLTPFEEPILVLANGRHSLLTEKFIRNTVPDRMRASQSGFPVNVRDADIDVDLQKGMPSFEQAMVLRIDTQLGFDPSSPWTFIVEVERQLGSFQPQIGLKEIKAEISLPARFFNIQEETDDIEQPLWVKSWKDQQTNLIILGLFICTLFIILKKPQLLLGKLSIMRPLILLFTVIFVGWIAQGQLSIVTVIAFLKALINTQSLEFLLFDPVSIFLWGIVLITFFLWGRGTFCGWLCPYGALQELIYIVGKKLPLKTIRLSNTLNKQLTKVKYVILFVLIGAGLFYTPLSDTMVEVEPFKTAITLQFERALPYVLYATFWLVFGLFIFKGFCRFICPLGAFMALGGKFRLFSWLARRKECGTPCQLCTVKCDYQAIEKETGEINYTECFQCLECVEIMDDKKQCVPLVLAAKKLRSEK